MKTRRPKLRVALVAVAASLVVVCGAAACGKKGGGDAADCEATRKDAESCKRCCMGATGGYEWDGIKKQCTCR